MTNTVRVEVFKPSGKWYTTLALKWTAPDSDILIHDAFRQCLAEDKTVKRGSLSGMIAVCFDPYHEHSHPIMAKIE